MKFGTSNIRPPRLAKRAAAWDEYVARHKAKLLKKRRKPSIWDWAADGQTGGVEAMTRSEARAMLKEVLGVKKLPKEVSLVARPQ